LLRFNSGKHYTIFIIFLFVNPVQVSFKNQSILLAFHFCICQFGRVCEPTFNMEFFFFHQRPRFVLSILLRYFLHISYRSLNNIHICLKNIEIYFFPTSLMKMILSSLTLVRKIGVCITSEGNLFNNLLH
jgi:hypothetical protein